MAWRKSNLLRTGEVSVEYKGKKYNARYDVLDGGREQLLVRLVIGQATYIRGMTGIGLARQLLLERVSGGRGDEGMSRDLGTRVGP